MACLRQLWRRGELHSTSRGVAILGALTLVLGCTGEIHGERPEGSAKAPGPGAAEEPSDWFAAVQAADCDAPSTPPRTRIRRLSTSQWINTVTAALSVLLGELGFPQDAISSETGFDTDATTNKINVLLANAYYDAGDALAPGAAAGALQAQPCLATTPLATTCAATFVQSYGARLFRRPLTTEESTRYAAFLVEQAALDPAEIAVGTTLRAFLLSPNMVYQTELGSSKPGEVELTPYEQAALLSYLIADAPPDAPLLQAAAQGPLDATERKSHATRLLQSAGARAKLADFWRQYLPLGDLRKAAGITPELATAIAAESAQHFDQIVWTEGGSFADLLTAPYTYGDASLSTIYGTMTPRPGGGSTLVAGQRSGFITQAGFLFSADDATVEHKIIQRGLAVRARLLCQPPEPPPPNLMPQASDLQPLGPDATPLESYQAFQSANPGCAGCHSAFQTIGLAFEAYDNLGHFRTTYEDGRAILTSSELVAAGDATGTYASAVAIAAGIAQSKIGEYCFSRQFAEYALGRHLHAALDACVIRAASDAAPQPPVRDLAVVLADHDAGSRRFHE
jgi:hypothetical protein